MGIAASQASVLHPPTSMPTALMAQTQQDATYTEIALEDLVLISEELCFWETPYGLVDWVVQAK